MMLPFDKVDSTVRPIAKEYCIFPSNTEKTPRKGVFLIHGIASTPQVFRPFAPQIADLGYIVHVCRVAGHGTTPSHLATTTYKDWYISVEQQYKRFKRTHDLDQITVIGHSLGALLATIVAERFPDASLVLMSAPFQIRSHIMEKTGPMLPLISKFIKYWLVPVDKLKLIKQRGAVVYNKHPVVVFYQVYRLKNFTYKHLSKITCPLLLIIGSEDEFVHPDVNKLIRQHVKSSVIEEYIAPDASHALIDTSDQVTFKKVLFTFLTKYNPPIF